MGCLWQNHLHLDCLNDFEKTNNVEKHILDWSNQDKGVSKTNVNGWHSQTDMNHKKNTNL